MPLEILETVFAHVRSDDTDLYFGSVPHSYNFEAGFLSWVVVSHICHYWRECALGMKRLWCVIQLRNRTSFASSAAATFLQRSYPLNITLYHNTYFFPSGAVSSLIDAFYASLAENRDRIAGIYLKGMVHQTAWMLLQEDLVNTVEIVVLCDSPIRFLENR